LSNRKIIWPGKNLELAIPKGQNKLWKIGQVSWCLMALSAQVGYNNNNNTNICKAHFVSIRAESEVPAVARWRGWLVVVV